MKQTSLRYNPWILCPDARPYARIQLICLAHAGGTAVDFQNWARKLPPEIELWAIQLPGRGNRMRDPCFDRMEPLVDALSRNLLATIDKPFAFFGYGMGSLVFFETTRSLRRYQGPQPTHFYCSACQAPQVFLAESPDPTVPPHLLSEKKLLETMQKLHFGGSEVLRDSEESRFLVLPTVRADLELCSNYEFQEEGPLDCPITAWGGLMDPLVSRSHLEAWKKQTRGDFEIFMLPGDHYFLEQHGDLILHSISEQLLA